MMANDNEYITLLYYMSNGSFEKNSKLENTIKEIKAKVTNICKECISTSLIEEYEKYEIDTYNKGVHNPIVHCCLIELLSKVKKERQQYKENIQEMVKEKEKEKEKEKRKEKDKEKIKEKEITNEKIKENNWDKPNKTHLNLYKNKLNGNCAKCLLQILRESINTDPPTDIITKDSYSYLCLHLQEYKLATHAHMLKVLDAEYTLHYYILKSSPATKICIQCGRVIIPTDTNFKFKICQSCKKY